MTERTCFRCGGLLADGDETTVVAIRGDDAGSACSQCLNGYWILRAEFDDLLAQGVDREEANSMMIERMRFSR